MGIIKTFFPQFIDFLISGADFFQGGDPLLDSYFRIGLMEPLDVRFKGATFKISQVSNFFFKTDLSAR